MTANVYKDSAADTSIMAPEYKNVASTFIVPMMQRSGIKKLIVKKIAIANATRIVPEVELFGSIPDKLRVFSIMAKYPLAELMLLFGITGIEINASSEEIDSMLNTYKKLVDISESINKSADQDAAKEKPSNGVEITDKMTKKALELANIASKATNPSCSCKKKSCLVTPVKTKCSCKKKATKCKSESKSKAAENGVKG